MSEQNESIESTPAPKRRIPALLGIAALVVATGVVSSLTTVWATHDFPDVPNSNPHHANISWLVENGITEGFDDGTYRPGNPVTRQAMATFMRRLSNSVHLVTDSTTAGAGSSWLASANCPAGERAIAGGFDSNVQTAYVTESYPVADTWFVRFQVENAGSINGADLDVWVLCAPGL